MDISSEEQTDCPILFVSDPKRHGFYKLSRLSKNTPYELLFSLFPGNANEQTSLKPLETKVLQDFGCTKFIYCSDAGLGSEAIKRINHAGERAFIVTQSIKKLNKDEKKWALDKKDLDVYRMMRL